MSDLGPVAREAARRWGLPEPEHLRTAISSLWAAGDDVVLRVAPLLFGAAAEESWMAAMSRLDVRVPRLLRAIERIDGHDVAAIERIHPSGEVDWAEVGAMVRRVHSIDPADVPGLQWCGGLGHWQVDQLLGEVRPLIDDAALRGLDATLARWVGWRERMREHLVVCHGDVHPGNVMPSPTGPVLIDWDLRCLGPAGWDHGPMMRWGERWAPSWGGRPGSYDDFARGYGQSLRGEWMAEAIGDLRLVIATLMRVRAGRTDAAAAEEAERRLRWWRGDADAPLWRPQ